MPPFSFTIYLLFVGFNVTLARPKEVEDIGNKF